MQRVQIIVEIIHAKSLEVIWEPRNDSLNVGLTLQIGAALMLTKISHPKSALIPVIFVCVGLAACAGRAPAPVQIVQAQDNQLSCDQIIAEISTNNEQLRALASEKGLKVTQNVVAGVAGLVVPVLWFGMDFQDAAGKEAQALSQRNGYLSQIAARRNCAGVAPVQPA